VDRYEVYRIIDEAAKGSFFYRFVLSPDPKREDHNHDLDMRDIAERTMLALEERLGVPIQWLGAVHADHAPTCTRISSLLCPSGCMSKTLWP
jgi:hypothetical protein